MSPEAQRIAIAEACGWTKCEHVASINLTKGIPPTNNPPKYGTYENGMAQIPDYLNDLNAMHEAEKFIQHSKKESYWDYLYENCQRSVFSSIDDNYKMITATAAQRAEAYLRTIGKWEGGSDE